MGAGIEGDGEDWKRWMDQGNLYFAVSSTLLSHRRTAHLPHISKARIAEYPLCTPWWLCFKILSPSSFSIGPPFHAKLQILRLPRRKKVQRKAKTRNKRIPIIEINIGNTRTIRKAPFWSYMDFASRSQSQSTSLCLLHAFALWRTWQLRQARNIDMEVSNPFCRDNTVILMSGQPILDSNGLLVCPTYTAVSYNHGRHRIHKCVYFHATFQIPA